MNAGRAYLGNYHNLLVRETVGKGGRGKIKKYDGRKGGATDFYSPEGGTLHFSQQI